MKQFLVEIDEDNQHFEAFQEWFQKQEGRDESDDLTIWAYAGWAAEYDKDDYEEGDELPEPEFIITDYIDEYPDAEVISLDQWAAGNYAQPQYEVY